MLRHWVAKHFLSFFATCLLLIILFQGSVLAQEGGSTQSVFLPLVFKPYHYSFFVAGHTYGRPGVDNPGVHPPFKDHFPFIKASGTGFGIFTGDIVDYGTAADWCEIDADIAELGIPVHFVVGNHDMTDRNLFVDRYGPTYYSFRHAGDLFIVLDGELDHCHINGDQLIFLQGALESDPLPNTVFIFVHKLIWVVEKTPYYPLINKVNGIGGYDFESNFWTDVAPLLYALDVPVYIVAGDVGTSRAMPLFWNVDKNIHFVASGMGGNVEENFLLFDVVGSKVSIEAYRLDNQPLRLGAVEAYNLAHYFP